jgi:hypothetical protein
MYYKAFARLRGALQTYDFGSKDSGFMLPTDPVLAAIFDSIAESDNGGIEYLRLIFSLRRRDTRKSQGAAPKRARRNSRLARRANPAADTLSRYGQGFRRPISRR